MRVFFMTSMSLDGNVAYRFLKRIYCVERKWYYIAVDEMRKNIIKNLFVNV